MPLQRRIQRITSCWVKWINIISKIINGRQTANAVRDDILLLWFVRWFLSVVFPSICKPNLIIGFLLLIMPSSSWYLLYGILIHTWKNASKGRDKLLVAFSFPCGQCGSCAPPADVVAMIVVIAQGLQHPFWPTFHVPSPLHEELGFLSNSGQPFKYFY